MLYIGMLGFDVRIGEYIKKILMDEVSQTMDWELYEMDNLEDFVCRIQHCPMDVVFLNMNCKECDKVQEYLEKNQMDIKQFYISQDSRNVFETFNGKDVPYILKPLREDDVVNALKDCAGKKGRKTAYYNVMIKGEKISIPLETILYFESNYRTIIVHTKYGKYEFYDKLNCVQEKLKNVSFLRCHQSYLVAAQKITDYDGSRIQIGEYTIPISYKYQKSVKDYLISREFVSMDESGKMIFGRKLPTARMLYEEHDMRGTMVCVGGENVGHTIQLVPEQEVVIGRDEKQADIVLQFPLVSRRHCVIVYRQEDNEFEITDYSLNGTFINREMRMETGCVYRLPAGSYVSFGNLDLEYRLG